MGIGKLRSSHPVASLRSVVLEDVIEVARARHVNHRVRNIAIVRVVHAIGVNTDAARITMANTAVTIDDVEKTCQSCFSDLSERSKHAIW